MCSKATNASNPQGHRLHISDSVLRHTCELDMIEVRHCHCNDKANTLR